MYDEIIKILDDKFLFLGTNEEQAKRREKAARQILDLLMGEVRKEIDVKLEEVYDNCHRWYGNNED